MRQSMLAKLSGYHPEDLSPPRALSHVDQQQQQQQHISLKGPVAFQKAPSCIN
jgi:hypothetical protein